MITKIFKFVQKLFLAFIEIIKILLTLIVFTLLAHFISVFIGWLAKKSPLDIEDIPNYKVGGMIILLVLFICALIYSVVVSIKAIIKWNNS